MSDQNPSLAPELVSLWQEFAKIPGITSRDAVALAVGTMQCEMLNDALIMLGDMADALNDMRPIPGERSLH